MILASLTVLLLLAFVLGFGLGYWYKRATIHYVDRPLPPKIVRVPVEKIVERTVTVPGPERVVEVERVIEVPVERIVEVVVERVVPAAAVPKALQAATDVTSCTKIC
jgi:hypothetical protein